MARKIGFWMQILLTIPINTPHHLDASTWQNLAHEHREQMREWTQPMRDRRSRGLKHPIHDFLTTYYSHSLGRLERWHPGANYYLEAADGAETFFPERHYSRCDGSIFLDPEKISPKERDRLARIHNLLRLTQSRPGFYNCHGLHEWAMVYRAEDIRHEGTLPLRLSQKETDAVVEALPIACSHFDAYRHFTPSALEFNRLRPTLDAREANEQSACLHANMDLYKWAYKSMPWLGSDLLRDTFLLSLKIRETDMRASPYDLSAFGHEAIKIETPAGRDEYARQQRHFADLARPLRQEMIARLGSFLRLTPPPALPPLQSAADPFPHFHTSPDLLS